MRESFILYKDDIEVFDLLDDLQLATLIRAIKTYQLSGIEPEIKDILPSLAFTQFLIQFNRDKEYSDINHRTTYVYCIEMNHKESAEQFIKIGISYRTATRYNDYKRLGYSVNEVWVKKFKYRIEAENEESNIHRNLYEFKYEPTTQFPGHTECFTIDILKIIGND